MIEKYTVDDIQQQVLPIISWIFITILYLYINKTKSQLNKKNIITRKVVINMKTKQQFEEKLYKSYFIDRKRNNTIAFGMFIVLIVAMISAIWKNKTLGVDLMVFGLLGFLIYSLVFIWFFFRPYDLEKEKQKLNQKITRLELEVSELQYKFNEKFVNKDLNSLSTDGIICHMQDKEKEEKKINTIQEKLWTLEVNLKMIGGTNQKNKQ